MLIIEILCDFIRNHLKLLFIHTKYNNISTTGLISFQSDVRIVCTSGSSMQLEGPIWLHRLSALHAEGGKITIGPRTSIGPFTIIAANEEIRIGSNCMIAEGVTIRDQDHAFENHQIPMRDQGWTTSPICIGDNVWIGAKATILKGCTIGSNVIIGSNSVVTKNIPGNSIAVGSPAKVIRELYTI